jgi:glycosyltransferase involved in cell wall biosynthesis
VLSPLLTQQTGYPIANGARLRRLLADGDFDVVNFHNVSLIGGPGLLAYGSGVKLYLAHDHWLVCPSHVLWRHGRELCTGRECFSCQLRHRRPPQWWRWTGLLEKQLAHVDTFIAMSEFSRDKHREFGFPREMEVLPYFLPDAPAASAPAQDAPPHPRPYFLFVGRLEEIKGVQDLLPAFAGDGDADLVVVGDGEFAPALRAMAAGMPRVHFTGRVASDQLGVWYRHAIASLVPSRCFETFGPLPEIVTRAGGGLIFETDDELRAAMARLQFDRAHRDALAAAGRQAVDTLWSEHAVVPAYLDIVRRAAERRQLHRILTTLSEDGVP